MKTLKINLKDRRFRIVILLILILGLLSLSFLMQTQQTLTSKANLDPFRVFQVTEPNGQPLNCAPNGSEVNCQTNQTTINFYLNQNGLSDIQTLLNQ